jgi:hypothetical protein
VEVERLLIKHFLNLTNVSQRKEEGKENEDFIRCEENI